MNITSCLAAHLATTVYAYAMAVCYKLLCYALANGVFYFVVNEKPVLLPHVAMIVPIVAVWACGWIIVGRYYLRSVWWAIWLCGLFSLIAAGIMLLENLEALIISKWGIISLGTLGTTIFVLSIGCYVLGKWLSMQGAPSSPLSRRTGWHAVWIIGLLAALCAVHAKVAGSSLTWVAAFREMQTTSYEATMRVPAIYYLYNGQQLIRPYNGAATISPLRGSDGLWAGVVRPTESTQFFFCPQLCLYSIDINEGLLFHVRELTPRIVVVLSELEAESIELHGLSDDIKLRIFVLAQRLQCRPRAATESGQQSMVVTLEDLVENHWRRSLAVG